jgi:hypothetical protein
MVNAVKKKISAIVVNVKWATLVKIAKQVEDKIFLLNYILNIQT